MDTSLLTCVRRGTVRLRLGVTRDRIKRPIRSWFLEPFRVLEALTILPSTVPPGTRFLFLGTPEPNSKTGKASRELVAAGVRLGEILHVSSDETSTLEKAGRLLLRLPWALGALLLLHRRTRHLDRLGLRLILGREAFRRFLERNPPVTPVIISDVSPHLHMLWSASEKSGKGALWWQDDFHHRWVPYGIGGAAVLNEAGRSAAVARSRGAVVAVRKTSDPNPVRPVPRAPRVGVATNAYFKDSPGQRALLETLARRLGAQYLDLRLHPRVRPPSTSPESGLVRIAPAAESMEEFAARIDLAVVGNSAVQLWLIRAGVPVVHIGGLDLQGFDRYGYVREQVVFGAPRAEELCLDRLRRFYADPEAVSERLLRYTSVRGDAGQGQSVGLEALARL